MSKHPAPAEKVVQRKIARREVIRLLGLTTAFLGLPVSFGQRLAYATPKEKKDVSFPCKTIRLEGLLELPSSSAGPMAGAVICHANPKLGASMNDQMITKFADTLLSKDIACLRFNFRGTGRSGGSHENGVGEIEDVRAALDFLQEQKKVNRNKLLVAGYSFGGWVGLKAASNDPRCQAVIGIAPPLNTRDFSFLEQDKRPKLLIAGDHDSFCSKDRFEGLVKMLPEPKRGVLIPGADHFNIGKDERVWREIASFVDQNHLA